MTVALGAVLPPAGAALVVAGAVAVLVALALGLTETLGGALLLAGGALLVGAALLLAGGALLVGAALLLDGGALLVGAALLLDGGALLVGAALVRAVVPPVPALGTEPIGASEVGVLDGLVPGGRGLTLLDTDCPGSVEDGSFEDGSRTSSSPPAVREMSRNAPAIAVPTSGPRGAPVARRGCDSAGS